MQQNAQKMMIQVSALQRHCGTACTCSDHLAHHHRSHSRKQGDAKSRQGILPLGYGNRRHDAGTQAGHGQLVEQFGAGLGAGQHGVPAGAATLWVATGLKIASGPGRYLD